MAHQPAILTAELFYDHPRAHWRHRPAAVWAWEKHPVPAWRRAMLVDLAALGRDVAKPQTFAYVNHGRWLVDCPFCGSTQVAAKTDRRFLCAGTGSCGNAPAGGAFVPVVWPKDTEAIEAVLVNRPDPNTRNWLPGETIKDLRRENVEHGIAA